MNHNYITTTGVPSAREVTLNYVTICLQIQTHDKLLASFVSGINSSLQGGNVAIDVVEKLLVSNDLAWNRRAALVEARTAAHAALVEVCEGNATVMADYLSTVAREFGVALEAAA